MLKTALQEPAVKETRGVLPAEARQRSLARGLSYFVVTALAYAVTFAAMLLSSGWPTTVAFALLNGLAVGMLFIIGHDACHGSLTPSSFVNEWGARLAFLPSLHPLSAWEYSHNALHHGWTNLRGKDPVYCPLTLEEFRALSPLRRRLERLFRSWTGLLPLYLFTIWWPLEISPRGEHRRHIDKRKTYGFDRGCVIAFVLLETVILALARGGITKVLIGVLIPFLAFSWLIGFATFQHHTHPRVVWYADETNWSFFRSQVEGTVHIVFPRWIELLLHNIMEHTAHHVDTRVPLYHLQNAQKAVERSFGADHVIVERFTFAGMAETFAKCQLYDFDARRWLSFDGVPTTESRVRPM
jgi:omega-6 fatty acid desaturase (delta-12 desaturase)